MHDSTIAVYGLGPASIFFLRNFFDTDIKINVYELGKEKDFLINFETNNHHHGGLTFGNSSTNPVNKNLQFKTLKNLYVNGSSIFPNSSIYNPTFTIIAFANRLSNFIYKKVKT